MNNLRDINKESSGGICPRIILFYVHAMSFTGYRFCDVCVTAVPLTCSDEDKLNENLTPEDEPAPYVKMNDFIMILALPLPSDKLPT